MKKAIFIAVISFIATTESRGQRRTGNDDLITVDVTQSSFPKKEMILQDFMDVEYIALETNDDFINQGVVMDIGKKTLIIRNRLDDGDIFVYDRTGKALQKINRKGQGGEEYTYITAIILDEDNGEMYVHSHYEGRIQVYDLYGKYKRSLHYKKNENEVFYSVIINYDRDNLIGYDSYNEEKKFVLLSKQDGHITKEIKIPYKEKKLLIKSLKTTNGETLAGPGPYRSISSYNGKWILLEVSSDTVFQLSPSDYSLRPFIVRTPPIQSMNPEDFLILRTMSDRYYFMEAIKNIYDFDTRVGFPRRFFLYDKREKSFFRYSVYNGDFSIRKEVYMNASQLVNHEIESCYTLETYQLAESHREGKLKGKLKELAATLNEDDNPVIMLVKHKK
jgi:hypothetical protein